MMTEKVVSSSAEVAILVGLHQSIGGPYKLVYLFRRLRCVHVYECVSQGREWYYSLHLTTDCRYTLRDMQPSTHSREVSKIKYHHYLSSSSSLLSSSSSSSSALSSYSSLSRLLNIQQQYPAWWIRGSGRPYPANLRDHLINDIDCIAANTHLSVLIIREKQHHLNISGCREKLVPSRLLYGVVPDTLLETYRFWEDESILPRGNTKMDENNIKMISAVGYKRMLGYPIDDNDGEYMIIIEFQNIGSWVDFIAPSIEMNLNCTHIIQSTRFPGRTIRITRRLKSIMVEAFKMKTRLAAVLESVQILQPFLYSKKQQEEEDRKKKADMKNKDSNKEKDELFKIDASVECNLEGKSTVDTLFGFVWTKS
jgi:hypothetical protein